MILFIYFYFLFINIFSPFAFFLRKHLLLYKIFYLNKSRPFFSFILFFLFKVFKKIRYVFKIQVFSLNMYRPPLYRVCSLLICQKNRQSYVVSSGGWRFFLNVQYTFVPLFCFPIFFLFSVVVLVKCFSKILLKKDDHLMSVGSCSSIEQK